MQKTLAEIARIVNGEVVGDKDLVITGLSGIKEAKEGDITFLSNPKYVSLTQKTKAAAIITGRNIDIDGKSVIRTDNPSLAFADLLTSVVGSETHPQHGIHETAFVGEHCTFGKNVSVGPCAVIEDHVTVGDGTVIYGGSYVGHHSSVGKNCIIYPNATVREQTEIGHRVIIHSGTVIGSDGFGYVQVEGEHKKIPQIGNVVIEDDVEIGANVTVDRARFDKTIIGRGTKIDNLVQIAHNVVMGENCIIISQTGISGSTIIGKGTYFLGQSGSAGHIKVGDGSIIFSQSSVTRSCPPGSKILGSPGREHAEASKAFAASLRLPHYIKIIKDLQKRVEELEAKND